jgi:hypothetical protein
MIFGECFSRLAFEQSQFLSDATDGRCSPRPAIDHVPKAQPRMLADHVLHSRASRYHIDHSFETHEPPVLDRFDQSSIPA